MNKLFRIILTAVASILIIETGLRAETITYISQTLNFTNFSTGSLTLSFNRINYPVGSYASEPDYTPGVVSVNWSFSLGYDKASFIFNNPTGQSRINTQIQHESSFFLTTPSTDFPFPYVNSSENDFGYPWGDGAYNDFNMGQNSWSGEIYGNGSGGNLDRWANFGRLDDPDNPDVRPNYSFFSGSGTFDIVLNASQSFTVQTNDGNLPLPYTSPQKWYGDMTFTYGLLGVPEPSAISLLAVGLGVVLRRRRRTV